MPQDLKLRKKKTDGIMSGEGCPGKLPARTVNSFRKSILGWYDANRRVLPWRAPPGQVANPYHVWLSEVMLQQTVVAAVIPYFLKFTNMWPTVHDLAAAESDDVMQAWAGLGYYARARNLHKCAKMVSVELDGIFPQDVAALENLPGIGPYTAAAIAAIAFDQPATAVDGNIERVMARYFAIRAPLPDSKPDIRQAAESLAAGRSDRPGDYTQALMDLGATVCTPQSPSCGLCPFSRTCQARMAGIAAQLPARKPKAVKPLRRGNIYWIVSAESGRILLERRPAHGLLGGMTGLPTSAWAETDTPPHPDIIDHFNLEPVAAKNVLVMHTFTHFNLVLNGYMVVAARDILAEESSFFWAEPGQVAEMGFPTVFKKFVKLMAHNRL